MRVDIEKIREAKSKLGEINEQLIVEWMQPEKYNASRHVCSCMNPAHEDHNPSCSYNKNTFSFYCFACSDSVDIIEAYIRSHPGSTFIDACKQLFELADVDYDFGQQGVLSHGRDYKYPQPQYAPNNDRVYDYWALRGISRQTIDYLDIREDVDGNTLFQYYDLNDVLVTVKVRLSRKFDKQRDRSKIWHLHGYDHADVLYNINRINPEQPLIIVTGEGDCAAMIECGMYNTVSINGGDQNTNWVGECWDWLEQFKEIIVVHDNDDSGRKFAKEISTRLGEYRVKIADLPQYFQKPNGTKVAIKDVNELLVYQGKEAVQAVIKDAKESEIPSLIDYTDVQYFSMQDVDGFTSGFKDLDNALGKFYMSSVTLITGAPGGGKSSFLSTLMCQAVDQGYPVFCYSGELSSVSLRSWIDFVFAGRYGLNEYQTASGGFYYKIKPDVFKQISDFYRGNMYFYKDSLDQKTDSVLQAAEAAVRRYGVKFLVFDNLSSLDLSVNVENQWLKQADFFREVIAFATRWNVCCCLVAHPRKLDTVRRMSLYDLGGTSQIVNLAHRALSLYRVPPKEQAGIQRYDGKGWTIPPDNHNVIIDVLKDRYGAAGNTSVKLWYDIPSKRFYDSTENLIRPYSWDTTEHTVDYIPFATPTSELSIDSVADSEVFGKI